MSAKDELLDSLDDIVSPVKKLDFVYLIYFLASLLLVVSIVFPKIYITQQIYYKSREIAKLKSEYDTLKEENKVISSSVEEIRYKNQVIDTLF